MPDYRTDNPEHAKGLTLHDIYDVSVPGGSRVFILPKRTLGVRKVKGGCDLKAYTPYGKWNTCKLLTFVPDSHCAEYESE